MIKSSNSDTQDFVCLTNCNIERYISKIPIDVQELTFWNYKMCIHPRFLESKESLCIPSLKKFNNLICLRIYNERLESFPLVPENTKKVMFISTIINNRSYNTCFNNYCYVNCIMRYPFYSSPSEYNVSAIGLFNSLVPYIANPVINNNKPQNKCVKRVTYYKRFMCSISECYWSLFPNNSYKVYPKEIEMTHVGSIEKLENRYKEIDYLDHSIESINRLKKIYDMIIDSEVITYRKID
jgi:hypothetical protein